MNKAILYGSIIITAILFGGCTAEQPTAAAPKPVAKVVAPSTNPSAKATPVAKAEAPEVKAVTDELTKLDSTKDFAPYTQSDVK